MRKKQTSKQRTSKRKKKHTLLQETQIGLKANLPTEMVIGSWIVMSFVG